MKEALNLECSADAARIKSFLSERVWAVVGASAHKEKFGYKVFKVLAEKWQVYPVNPGLVEIDGIKCYPSLSDLPEVPAVVNIITPPAVTLKIIEECATIGIAKVWMQPGAESPEAINLCLAHGINVISDRCAKVEARNFAH
jgi:hypothetical protein